MAGSTTAAASMSPPAVRRSLVSGSASVCTTVNPWSRLRSAPARSASVEQVGLLAHDAVVEGLEAEPPGDVAADLAAGELGLSLVDENGLAGGLRHQLHLAGALHGDEPEGGFVDRVADGEQPVVAKDHRLAVAQSVGQALALFQVEDDTGVVVEQGVVAVEGADVLGQGVEKAAQGRPRLAVRRVRVGGSNDLGSGRMHLRVDDERGRGDGT